MDSDKSILETQVKAKNRSDSDSKAKPRFGIDNRGALLRIFQWMCYFAAYLMLVQILGGVFPLGRLASALVQFIPYCCVLVVIVYYTRALAKLDEQALLMAACLASVFVVLSFDVTKNLEWFVGLSLPTSFRK